MTTASCPKCGNPRPPTALDCPWCGVVFARWRGAPVSPATPANVAGSDAAPAGTPAAPPPGEVAPLPADLHRGPDLPPAGGGLYAGPDDLYDGPPLGADPLPGRGGAAGRQGARPAMDAGVAGERVPHFETPFTRVLPVSLIMAALCFVAMQALWASTILGGSADAQRSMTAFRIISGLEPPEGLVEAATINFVGRRVIVLSPSPEEAARADAERRFELNAVVVHHGRLAGNASHEEMLGLVDRALDFGKIPRFVVSEHEVEFAGRAARARTLGLGRDGHEAARVFALSFTAHDGRPALLVVVGPTVEVTMAVRRYLL